MEEVAISINTDKSNTKYFYNNRSLLLLFLSLIINHYWFTSLALPNQECFVKLVNRLFRQYPLSISLSS